MLKQGFVVVDIGCMVEGYASDMTRTFPVGGTCTPAQQKLLDVVAAAKGAAERILKPGVTMRQLNDAARGVIDRAGFGNYWLHRSATAWASTSTTPPLRCWRRTW